MVNHLDHAINILKWNIEDERKNYDNKWRSNRIIKNIIF
jgi:hypothetical protein